MRLSFALRASTAFLSSVLLCVSNGTTATVLGQAGQPATRISAIKVSTVEPTFDGQFGTLNDVFANQTGNAPVFAGSGAANHPTRHLLVMVETTGEAWNPSIELTGREGRIVVYKKIAKGNITHSGSFTEPVKTYAFFFIDGDRCDTIRLTARLLGQRRPSTMTKTIEFACGE